ncbi:MAG: tRNA-intron lyase [Nitrososphaera sp.]|jgi:tRNA-intron endonuclease
MNRSGSEPVVQTAGEVTTQVEARMQDGRMIVDDPRMQDELRGRGFGEVEAGSYVLKSFEALYLKHTERLAVTGHPAITFENLFELLLKDDSSVLTKFLIYRDLRSRGYVAKEGFGFGIDFRVYERGDYQSKPAKYVVFGISEGNDMKVRQFASSILQVEKMGKEAIIAVIERRGEVIYYKTSSMRFNPLGRKSRDEDKF